MFFIISNIFTLLSSFGLRASGVALLLAGYDDRGPQLYFSDPSGTYTQYKAKAIGQSERTDMHIMACFVAPILHGFV